LFFSAPRWKRLGAQCRSGLSSGEAALHFTEKRSQFFRSESDHVAERRKLSVMDGWLAIWVDCERWQSQLCFLRRKWSQKFSLKIPIPFGHGIDHLFGVIEIIMASCGIDIHQAQTGCDLRFTIFKYWFRNPFCRPSLALSVSAQIIPKPARTPVNNGAAPRG